MILIFVMFVADDPHFDRMFKMVIIFTECLKWSSFSQFMFYLIFFVTPFKSLMEHCTGGTICIRVCYVYCTCVVIRYLGINKWPRVLVRNVWAVGEFDNLVLPFSIGVVAIFFFLQSHYIDMLRSQSSSFIFGCNRWRQPCSITSCTVGGSTRNGLTPICSCGDLRMARTPKNIGRKFWVQSIFYFCVNNKLVLIFGLLIYRVVVPIMWLQLFQMVVLMKRMSSSWHKWGQINDDLEKSLKVAEKMLQLVIGFTCVIIVLFVLLLCVIF